MSHSRRSSRSRGSMSGGSGDPFNDAHRLESAYTSSDDDATPVAPRRMTEAHPASQLAIPHPVVLSGPVTFNINNYGHQRHDSTDSEDNHLSIPSPARRGSVYPRQGSVTGTHLHPPPPVSLQTRPRQRSIAARRPSHSSRSTASHSGGFSSRDGTHSRDGRSSSELETSLSEWHSDLSDSHSTTSSKRHSGIYGYEEHSASSSKRNSVRSVHFADDNPFATPRKGSVIAEAETEQPDAHNRDSVRTVGMSTRSSQLSPFAPARRPRRLSDQVDPSRPEQSSRYDPTKYSPRKQRGHTRNFSRPFDSSASSLADEQQDRVTEMTQVRSDAMFDPAFSFRDGLRTGSHSLHPENQLEAQNAAREQLQDLDEKALQRRKSSCVLVNRRKSIYSIEEEKVVRAEGKRRLKGTKWAFIAFFILANAACITISWKFEKYWWVFAPAILLGNCLNTAMVLNLTRFWLWREFMRLIGRDKPPVQPTPTTIAMVLACYCENYDELMATLESLHDQENIEMHKKMFLVIVDGQVKGKGMTKTTDRILVEDIFKPEKEEWFPVGYESWDGVINGIYACSGEWRGVPYVCLVKKRNLGKRDGLILVRTLLYKYQFRYENPETSMGDDFFRWFCDFSESLGIDKYEWLVGVDADTTFNRRCIYEMHYKCIQDERLIGCSGLIQVGFRTGNWNLWNLYQNTEYIRAQCLRRMHQAKGTGKVSCLPGACQIIKICEETCCDKILIDTFGHIPDPKDNMIHQVRALAGEDRNYICIIFKHFPKAITTMSLEAIAYTDPPNGVWVFLSQRKRWTLSTSANDLLICGKNAMNWFERICSAADVIVWVLPIFVAQTIILFIRACVHADSPVFILSFATVTIIPLIFGLVVTYWACHGWRERVQYLCGFFMVVLMGQMITPIVISYAIWHMDDFSWGKTREIEDDGTNKPAHSD